MSRERFNRENPRFQRMLDNIHNMDDEEDDADDDLGAVGWSFQQELPGHIHRGLMDESLQMARANPRAAAALAAFYAGVPVDDDDVGFSEEMDDDSDMEDMACSMNDCVLSEADAGVVPDVKNTGAGERYTQEQLRRTDETGRTALHRLIEEGRYDVVSRILAGLKGPSCYVKGQECYAVLNIPNKKGRTCLHLAVMKGQACLARQLVMHGAVLEARDSDGNTPLHIACARGDLSTVKCLTAVLGEEMLNIPYFVPFTKLPQDMDAVNKEGLGFMHLAAACGVEELTVHLVNKLGADVNQRETRSGRTALHIAAAAGLSTMVRCLIERCGADVHVKSSDGWTPIQSAMMENQQETAEILLNYIKKCGKETSEESDTDEC